MGSVAVIASALVIIVSLGTNSSVIATSGTAIIVVIIFIIAEISTVLPFLKTGQRYFARSTNNRIRIGDGHFPVGENLVSPTLAICAETAEEAPLCEDVTNVPALTFTVSEFLNTDSIAAV
jgi:predicted cation transporter